MHNSVEEPVRLTSPQAAAVSEINRLDRDLLLQFKKRLRLDSSLSRALVSFQANKTRPGYRWYKFKEAFSASLVESLIDRYQIKAGKVLDPFAGSGTALFAASAHGLEAEGIELLLIGQQIILARKLLEESFDEHDAVVIRRWIDARPWEKETNSVPLPEIRITRGAYSTKTKALIERYLAAMSRESVQVQAVLRLALLCVLECVSYTRKDGQYLRWDYRSGRKQGNKQFDKGAIYDFDSAICAKLAEMLND